MSMFQSLYDRALIWAAHRHAPYYLGGLSFAESTFFPIPPDVMLLPMSVAKPDRAWVYALITTLASVLGGMAGYLIGAFAFESIEPWLMASSHADTFLTAKGYFAQYGFWFILVAGFSPIPYKVFTITAGVVGMPFVAFMLGSLVGRGGRFFLEAALIRLGGPQIADKIRPYVEWMGWILVGLVVIGLVYLQIR